MQDEKAEQHGGPTMAVHASSKDGALHAVGIGDLRVMLFNDDGSWFAQGLEIDYFAQGDDLEDAKRRFERGLYATLDEHLSVYGTIADVLEPAPAEVWKEFYGSKPTMNYFSQFAFHRPQLAPGFERIQYLSEAAQKLPTDAST